jgi:hypothetical protein
VIGFGIRPVQIGDGLGELAAVLLVESLQAQVQTGHDGNVGLGLSWGSAAFQCHCSTREELTTAPSSSAKQVVAGGTPRSGSKPSPRR